MLLIKLHSADLNRGEICATYVCINMATSNKQRFKMQCKWFVLDIEKQISIGQVIESTGKLYSNNVEMCKRTKKERNCAGRLSVCFIIRYHNVLSY